MTRAFRLATLGIVHAAVTVTLPKNASFLVEVMKLDGSSDTYKLPVCCDLRVAAADLCAPGALPRRLVGHGWQLYVRTARHAYVAYLRPLCGWKGKHVDAAYSSSAAWRPVALSGRCSCPTIALYIWCASCSRPRPTAR